jgi:hypothetical protein
VVGIICGKKAAPTELNKGRCLEAVSGISRHQKNVDIAKLDKEASVSGNPHKTL